MTVKRITFLQELLAFVGLEGRVHLEWISSAEAQKFVQVVTDFTEKIRSLGPNPLTGALAAGALQMLSGPCATAPLSQAAQLLRPHAADIVEEGIHESNSETVA
jgi:F420-non-reducing hydrogenase iron-sulfur subunit